jgi:hypothetical protein
MLILVQYEVQQIWKIFLPYRVDLICGISKMLLYLKEYLEFFIWTRSWRQTGVFHLKSLNTKRPLHISTICRKASHQLNILKRLGSHLKRLDKSRIDLYYNLSWRQTGAILLIMLYVSKAMVLILLICKEGDAPRKVP